MSLRIFAAGCMAIGEVCRGIWGTSLRSPTRSGNGGGRFGRWAVLTGPALVLTILAALACATSATLADQETQDSNVLAVVFHDLADKYPGPPLLLREGGDACVMEDWSSREGDAEILAAYRAHGWRTMSKHGLPVFPVLSPASWVSLSELGKRAFPGDATLFTLSLPGFSPDGTVAVVCTSVGRPAGGETFLVVLKRHAAGWQVVRKVLHVVS
jgi:hypothetical protein